MKEFLDLDGLSYFYGKIKQVFPKTVNGISPDENGNIELNIANLPVGYEFFTFNPTTQTGVLPLLGGTYSREAYKDLWEWVQKQGNYLISESEWQQKSSANNGNVPFYSTGDGSTTFRVPSIKCWVKGATDTEEIGQYLPTGVPNIKGQASTTYSVIRTAGSFGVTGALKNSKQTGGNVLSTPSFVQESSGGVIDFDAHLSNPIYGNADTVQPESIVGLWCVKAFGTVSNVGNQDVAELSAEVIRVGTQVNEVESKVNEFENNTKIIYPNNGTAEQPANITIKTQYVEENPFKGYYVKCDCQILQDGKWGSVQDFMYASGGYGARAEQLLPDDNIIISTGGKSLSGNYYDTGNPFLENKSLTTAPCRVIVHKFGKIGE